MIRLKKDTLSEETKALIEEANSTKNGITRYGPALAKGCEPSRGLQETVKEAKRKFKNGEIS